MNQSTRTLLFVCAVPLTHTRGTKAAKSCIPSSKLCIARRNPATLAMSSNSNPAAAFTNKDQNAEIKAAAVGSPAAQSIVPHPGISVTRDGWVRMFRKVMPNETDYSSNLWHGAYVRMLEEARVLALSIYGLPYDQLVSEYHMELVVHELSIQYKKPAKMGTELYIKVKAVRDGIRIKVEGVMENVHDGTIHATSMVSLAPISTKNGRVTRDFPYEILDNKSIFVDASEN